jgi:hypothetical protein
MRTRWRIKIMPDIGSLCRADVYPLHPGPLVVNASARVPETGNFLFNARRRRAGHLARLVKGAHLAPLQRKNIR